MIPCLHFEPKHKGAYIDPTFLFTGVQDWVGASVKYRRMVEWAPEAEFQLKEACSDRERDRRTGGRGEKRFFAGDYEGAKR